MKICIIVFSLGKGGAERATATLSRHLVNTGFTVDIICIVDDVEFLYKGRLHNLDKLSFPRKGILKRIFKFRYIKKLLSQEKYDYLLDTRARQSGLKQLFLKWFLFDDTPVIYLIHSFYLPFYFPKNKLFTRYLYGNAYQFVAVSEGIVKHFKNKYSLNHVRCIYNAIDRENLHLLSNQQNNIGLPLPKKFILAYGRLVDEIKDFSFLISRYAESSLPDQNIKLIILGEGPDLSDLQNLVESHELSSKIIFIGYNHNPFPYVKNALFTTLTSNFEGFPMVLVESLVLGTPVVAVDCKSGPSEVIETGVNGVLVPFKDPHKFVEALNRMAEDPKFYKNCKKGTIPSVEKFKMDYIAEQWKDLLTSKP